MPALPRPVLCLVTGGNIVTGLTLPDAVDAAVAGGVNVVQLREKERPAREVYDLALRLKDVCHGRALLMVNDRVDVALAAGVDGVQLGEQSLPLAAARAVTGKRILLGRSVHSVQGAIAAHTADFLVVGTIFASASHPGEPAAGAGLISRVVEAVGIPVIGIGGINADNASEVMAAGAAGVAVIGAILGSLAPGPAATALRRAIDGPSPP
ncbi:MAG: thiamine phosphate synthase [Chloroflexi bacterium]|nr:thiamine phosphate synthase [Chloroflexota bacterium]